MINMMKFFLIPVVLCMAITTSFAQFKGGEASYSDLNDSETVASFKKHVSYLASASMEGRAAGSEGEKAAADYLYEVMKSYGIDMLSNADGDLFGIKKDNGDTLTSRNVVGFIGGYDKQLKNSYIVIGARMDNLGVGSITVDGERQRRTYYGANGNASGMAMLMELSRMLSTNSLMLRRSVLLVGFGASDSLCAGAWYFLNRSFPDVANIDAMINLDMLGTGDSGFYAYTSSNADMNDIATAIGQSLQPIMPQVTSQEPYSSDHRVFYDKQIPSVFFTSGKYPEHNTEKDTPSILNYEYMEKELEYIYSYAMALINGSKPIFNPSEPVRTKTRSKGDVYSYYDCDQKPAFLGSTDPATFLEKWVYHYLKYPNEAVKKGIQGRVLVDFIIDESGAVTEAKILRSVDPLLDDEALRIVNASPKWRAGRVRGQKVKTQMTITVEFKLTKKGSFGIKK